MYNNSIRIRLKTANLMISSINNHSNMAIHPLNIQIQYNVDESSEEKIIIRDESNDPEIQQCAAGYDKPTQKL